MAETDVYGICSLEEILAARDARHAIQMQLLKEYPGKALICLTVVMPGERKCNRLTKTIGDAACKAIKETFGSSLFLPRQSLLPDNPRISKTGYEAFFLASGKILEVKKASVDIEDTHPLGRLFDIDVIGSDGVPVSRSQLKADPRKCLLCDNEARLCMRLHTHTHQELLEKIGETVAAWEKEKTI